MTGKTVGSTSWTYGWDRENRMVSAADSTNTVGYQYDALGRRIKRTQGSDVQKYTNDRQDVLLDDVNSTITTYQNGLGIDNKLEFKSGSTSKYFLADHLRSTAVMTNASGSSADSTSNDSFGNASNSSFASRYQFTGRELDPFTGLQFSRARFYDANLGRFVSEDPIGLQGGTNLYAYVYENPENLSDPSGFFPSMLWWKIHQDITQRALAGVASQAQIDALNAASQSWDARRQDPIFAPYHAMRRPGQSVDEARSELNEFVFNRICQARGFESRGLDLSAMELLGQAIHAMQDAESPAHTGFQEAWPNTRFFTALHVWYYLNETLTPGEDNITRARNNTLRIWAYFKGYPMPSDFMEPNGQKGCQCEN